MTASAEQELSLRLRHAQLARASLVAATGNERYHTTRFMAAALHYGWSWQRIGDALGVTSTGARRYYERNRTRL